MRQKLSDPGAFETRRVATEAAMREDIPCIEFNILGELELSMRTIDRRSLSHRTALGRCTLELSNAWRTVEA